MSHAALSPLHRVWRSLPAGPRRAALRHAGALFAPRPDRLPPPVAPGLAVLGEFARPSGLGMGARLMHAAAAVLGQPAVALDSDRRAVGLPPAAMPLVVHVNPPSLPWALLRQRRDLLRGRRVIGYWAWELPVAPPVWAAGAGFIHELWVPSRFCAEALRSLLPAVPLHVVAHPVAVVPPRPAALGRADFGLPEDAVLTLVSFNLASSFVRKNPLAAIAAHRAAFADRPDRVTPALAASSSRSATPTISPRTSPSCAPPSPAPPTSACSTARWPSPRPTRSPPAPTSSCRCTAPRVLVSSPPRPCCSPAR